MFQPKNKEKALKSGRVGGQSPKLWPEKPTRSNKKGVSGSLAHSAKQEIWKPTFASTLEKSHLNARNVVSPVLEAILSNNIWPGIQQKMTSASLQCDDDLNLKQ